MNQLIDAFDAMPAPPFAAAMLAELNPDSGTKSYRRLPYERGSFTPAFSFQTPGDLSVSYGGQVGRFVRLGEMVFVSLDITWTPTHTTASGFASITGLPFSSHADVAAILSARVMSNLTWPTSNTQAVAQVGGGQNFAIIVSIGTGVATATWGTTQFPTGVARQLRISGWFIAA